MAETVKGLNIKLSLDGRDLENELKEIQSDFKEQQKDLKAINTNLKYDSSNVELWKQKQSKLNEILQTTKKKLETQNLELEKAKQAVKVGDMSEAEFSKLARIVAYTKAEVIKEVKDDLTRTAENVSDLVQKAKDIVFDESNQKTLKEFIMIVEEKNRLAKDKGEAFLAGDEKKKADVSRLSEWVSNLTGSTEKAISFVETNQSKIESIIDEDVSFSNKMHGRASLSEAEKIIQEQLKK